MTTIFIVFALLMLGAAALTGWLGYRRYRASGAYAFLFGMATAFLIAFVAVLLYMGLVTSILRSLLLG